LLRFFIVDPFARRAVLPVPPVEGIEVQTRSSSTGRALDMYRRPGLGSERAPAVIFIPGDGPEAVFTNAKDWGQYVSWAQLMGAIVGRG
jgi:hypothetical protein